MSFEQPAYSFSYPGGEPPTPTKTPTSPTFFLNSFHTPKPDARFHDPFSPWSPAFASATTPNLKTPTRWSFATPTKSPITSSIGKNVEAEIASHVHNPSQEPSIPLPPVEPLRQVSSSPNAGLASETKRRRLNNTESSITPLKTSFSQEASQSMNSAGSMQTPPPTSTSASRRKAQQAQVARLVKESAEKGRRMSFPALSKMDNTESSNSQVEESPQHFSTLQFSPEGFGFSTAGPATAPVYPQHRLFWDPEQNGDTMNIDFPMDDSFAAYGMQRGLDPFESSHNGGGIQFPTSPAFNLLGTPHENVAPFTSSGDLHSATRTASSTTMARKASRGNGVDPSLLFSSPGRAAEASNMPSTSQTIQDDNLLPYAHQLRDAQMELEMQMSRKSKRKRGAETDSPAVKAALQTLRDDQAGIKRDLADEVIPYSATQRSSSRTSSRFSNEKDIAGHSTLQKQRSRSRLQDSGHEIATHKRTSVTLTIDASGRAKTEAKFHPNDSRPPKDRVEVDSGEDSDSASSSSNDEMVMSQTQSFAYPSKQRQPKLGRFTHKPQSHSQRSSYASTLGSRSNIQAAPETAGRRPASNLSIQSNVQNRHPRVSFNDHVRDGEESEAETIIDSEDDKGDAQSALKKLLQSRQKKGSKQSFGSGSKNPYNDQRDPYRPYSAPSHPYPLADSFTPTRNGYNQSYNNISPTTITDPDLATPSSGRSNISNDVVRCLCHSSDDDGTMVQCESCKAWQHLSCLGLPPNPQMLPAVHLCVFCTATPNVRGGRVREPARAAFPPPSSPLAHKSHRYR